MSPSGATQPGKPATPRAAIATALEALAAAESSHTRSVDRAAADRDTARKQAAAEETNRVQQATSAAAKRRNAVNRVVAETDRLSRQADQALAAASVKHPAALPPVTVPASASEAELELIASQRAMQAAFASLGQALKELERVRRTLIVRALRKVGLPPL